MQTTRDGVNGGTLPCIWLVHATSGDSVTKQPHLSPQHYELNDSSMCWIGQEYRLAMFEVDEKTTSLGEAALQT